MRLIDLEKKRFIDYVSNPQLATSKFHMKNLDLETALKMIPIRFGPWDLMTIVGTQHYNLRHGKLNHLLDVIESNQSSAHADPCMDESDREILRQMKDECVSFYFRPVLNRRKPSGGFWPFWHKLPLDLSRYGLFQKVPHHLSNLNTKRDLQKFKSLLKKVAPIQYDSIMTHVDSFKNASLDDLTDSLITKHDLLPSQMEELRALNEMDSYRVSCLERVLIAWGIPPYKMEIFFALFRETHLHGLRHIARTKLQQLADSLSINIILKRYTGKIERFRARPHVVCLKDSIVDLSHDASTEQAERWYSLGEYENHYVVLETVPITSWALDHVNEIKHLPNWGLITGFQIKKGKKYPKRVKSRCISSWQLIKKLTQSNSLSTPIRGDEPFLRESIHFNTISRRNRIHSSLRYPKNNLKPHRRKMTGRSFKGAVLYFWFDFESSTEGTHHQDYEVACVDEKNEIMYFGGVNKGKDLLDAITVKVKHAQKRFNTPSIRVVMVAHYLTYDFQFMIKHLHLRSDNLMSRSNVKLVKGRYQYSPHQSFQVWLKDSACLIPMALSKFGASFNLKKADGSSLEKDVMPYGAMTQKSLKLDSVPLSAARACMEEEDYSLFKKNLTALDLLIPKPDSNEDHFAHKEYSKYYCIRDVEVLKAGYQKWKEMMFQVTGLDINDQVTLPSLAHSYACNSKVYDDVVRLCGIPREFIQKSVEGGRTMTRENKMWHVTKRLQDLDGRSLYPSAMYLMPGVLLGAPKVLSPTQISMINADLAEAKSTTLLDGFDGYFLRIHVTLVAKKFAFPLLSKMDSRGIRQYANDTGYYYVDRFKLEDLIEFHKITFKVMQGYYFDEGRNTTMKEFMSTLYQERLRYKKEGNMIEKVFKELMNSTYGRTMMKPIEKDLHFVYGKKALQKKLDWFHYCHNGYDVVDAQKEIYLVEVEKSRGTHFAMPHVGAEILSYSKRIMNQVLCLAEDIGAIVYYQDTDSMHIEESHIEMLREAFTKKYDKELIGKQMGQFHCDFEVPKGGANPVSIESIFLGKKAYIDHLEYTIKERQSDSTMKEMVKNSFHVRLKGVPTPCVKKHAEMRGISLLDLYRDLYEHKTHAFDLLNRKHIKPYFERGRTFVHSNRSNFVRRLSFKNRHG